MKASLSPRSSNARLIFGYASLLTGAIRPQLRDRPNADAAVTAEPPDLILAVPWCGSASLVDFCLHESYKLRLGRTDPVSHGTTALGVLDALASFLLSSRAGCYFKSRCNDRGRFRITCTSSLL